MIHVVYVRGGHEVLPPSTVSHIPQLLPITLTPHVLTSTPVVAELEDALAVGEVVALDLLGRVGLVAKAAGVAEEVVREVASVRLAEALTSEPPAGALTSMPRTSS